MCVVLVYWIVYGVDFLVDCWVVVLWFVLVWYDEVNIIEVGLLFKDFEGCLEGEMLS